jgi:hypothetical protein
VQRLLRLQGVNLYGVDVRGDETLVAFLEEQLTTIFGICGKRGKCEQLEKNIKEAKERNPSEFEALIDHLLQKYLKLQMKIREALKTKKEKLKAPPDRFLEQFKKAKEVWKSV